MLNRAMQMTGKIEDEEGSLESLTAAEAKTIVYNPSFKPDPEMHEGDPVRSAGGAQAQLIGKIPAGLTFQYRMRGPGTVASPGTVITDPDWVKYLRCCGFSTALLKSSAIGAVASGPFQHGETIVGTSSGAQGIVIFNTATGTTPIYYILVGTVNFASSETITGGTSGATATTAGAAASAGRCWRPITDVVPSLSAALNQDGYLERLSGGRGNVKFSIAAGGPGLFDCSFQGADAGQTDELFLTGVAYEDRTPPVLKSATILLDAYTPKLQSIDFDMGAQLAMREDPAKSGGVLSFAHSGRKITGTIVVERVLAGTYDFRGKFHAGTTMVVSMLWGSSPSFRLYYPKMQILNVAPGDKDGIQNLSLSYQANGGMDKENDMVIVQM